VCVCVSVWRGCFLCACACLCMSAFVLHNLTFWLLLTCRASCFGRVVLLCLRCVVLCVCCVWCVCVCAVCVCVCVCVWVGGWVGGCVWVHVHVHACARTVGIRTHQKAEASERNSVALSENLRRVKMELLASKTEVRCFGCDGCDGCDGYRCCD
jgi:hypothetical protein